MPKMRKKKKALDRNREAYPEKTKKIDTLLSPPVIFYGLATFITIHFSSLMVFPLSLSTMQFCPKGFTLLYSKKKYTMSQNILQTLFELFNP